MPNPHTIAGAAAVAVASISTTLLTTKADHDLVRSYALIGIMVSISTGLYLLIDRRMSRVERATARVVSVDHDILAAIHRQQRGAGHFN